MPYGPYEYEYEPTSWKNGDVITDTKLNKIEQGIAHCYMPVLDLADFTELEISGLVFQRPTLDIELDARVTIYAPGESQATPLPGEEYYFYSASPETFNAIILATPTVILNSDAARPYLGIGYATDKTFYGASDLVENDYSSFGTFNGTCNCVIIDIMSKLTASSVTPVTRILIMPETELRRVDDPSGSSEAPV